MNQTILIQKYFFNDLSGQEKVNFYNELLTNRDFVSKVKKYARFLLAIEKVKSLDIEISERMLVWAQSERKNPKSSISGRIGDSLKNASKTILQLICFWRSPASPVGVRIGLFRASVLRTAFGTLTIPKAIKNLH